MTGDVHIIAITAGGRSGPIRTAADVEAVDADAATTWEIVSGDWSAVLNHDGPATGDDLVCSFEFVEYPNFAFRGDTLSENVSEKYTRGDCEILAVAIAELSPDFSIVAMREPHPDNASDDEDDDEDEDSDDADRDDGDSDDEREELADLLIHAAVILPDGRVVDVEGVRDDVQAWAFRWGENATTDGWDYGGAEREELEEMQGAQITEEELEDARPWARLIAGLVGAWAPAHEAEAESSFGPFR